MEDDVRRTLKSIIEYIGADSKYADYAELQSVLEKLVKRNQIILEAADDSREVKFGTWWKENNYDKWCLLTKKGLAKKTWDAEKKKLSLRPRREDESTI